MVSAISKAASLMGSVKSKKKAAAARKNGAKGGRPRLPATALLEHKPAIWQRVCRAIRAGLFVRPDYCSQCGAKRKVYAHHRDYGQPLFLQWLCARCHSRAHKNNN